MKLRVLGSAAAGLLAMTMLALPVSADTIGGATVRTVESGLNLRAAPSEESESLDLLPSGSFLLVEEALDGWYHVVRDGVEGYVAAEYVDFAEEMGGTVFFDSATLGTDVNLRSAPGTDAQVLKNYGESGEALVITGVDGQWLRVMDSIGMGGYIRSDLVYYKEEIPLATDASEVIGFLSDGATVGEQLVETAKQYIGYNYCWGGMSPQTGFDCSGFANYIYNQYGYTMERVAQNIYNTNGVSVSRDELQPGDLLFFGYGASSITHVGIYAGNGQMVHASTSKTGVILSDIENSGYYTRMYVGAKRILA